MEIKPEELLDKLQQHKQIPKTQVILLCGEEDYYRNSIAAALPDYLYGETPVSDREISVFDKDTNMAELNAVINTYPFFCGQSLVILKDEGLWKVTAKQDNTKEAAAGDGKDAENIGAVNVQANKNETDAELNSKKMQQLQDLLNDVPDYCTVLLCAPKLDKRTKLYKQLKKTALICSCDRLKEKELPEWLQQQAAAYGAKFAYDAVGMIMEYIEPVKDDIPLDLLRQELAKLAAYAGGRNLWTRQDVLATFAALPGTSAFAILNALMAGKLKSLLELLSFERRHGTSVLPLCALIAFKLRQAARYLELQRSGCTQKEIMQELGLGNPYAYKFLANDCRRFDEARLQQAVLQLAELNINMRLGKYAGSDGGAEKRQYEELERIFVKLLA